MNTVWIVLPVLIALMFQLGIELDRQAFAGVARRPAAVVAGLLGQLALLPLIAFGVGLAFRLPPVYFLGLLLVACCPGGSSSNVFSMLAKGDVALSVTLTALSSLITLFTIPLVMGFAARFVAVHAGAAIELPVGKLLVQNIVLLFLPMLCGAFFPQATVPAMVSLYLIGIAVGCIAALVLTRTAFKGDPVPFIMELPNYRLPSVKTTVMLAWDKAKDFVTKAFTIIFAATVVIWFLQTFDIRFNVVADQSQSLLAGLGSIIAPVLAPLGFGDWRASTALVTGLIAKESVISTLTVLLGATSPAALSTMFSPFTAYVFLVFTLLYPPCVAAIGAVKSELGARYAVAVFAFQVAVAWIVAFVVHSAGILLGLA